VSGTTPDPTPPEAATTASSTPPNAPEPPPPEESLGREVRALLTVLGAIALLSALYGMAFAPPA